MKKYSLLIGLTSVMFISVHAQIGSFIKNKVKGGISKDKIDEKSFSTTKKYITEQELSEDLYSEKDRYIKTEKGDIFIKGNFKKQFTDQIDLSGVYYLSEFAFVSPSSHFDKSPLKAYGGFSLEYNTETYELNLHWEEGKFNNGFIPEFYRSSADRGNIQFQMGMLAGPDNFYNANCLLLEPGVILIGAEVYHKNDEVGHQWMNNIQPQSFIIAAKDTSKIKDYQFNIEHTEKVVFQKFDVLKKQWDKEEIENAKPLPAEGMTTQALKNEAKQLITQRAKAYQWKEQIEYAYIQSKEWDVELSLLTGKPIKRKAHCIVIMKTPKGNYKREGFNIAQKYNGTGYGKTYMLFNDQNIHYVSPKEAFKYK